MAKKSRTLNDLFSVHDKSVVVPNKIRAALAELVKEGPENHEPEIDFTRRAHISTIDLAAYREPFMGFCVTLGGRNPKRIWFGDLKVATKARQRLNLSE